MPNEIATERNSTQRTETQQDSWQQGSASAQHLRRGVTPASQRKQQRKRKRTGEGSKRKEADGAICCSLSWHERTEREKRKGWSPGPSKKNHILLTKTTPAIKARHVQGKGLFSPDRAVPSIPATTLEALDKRSTAGHYSTAAGRRG